MRVVEYVIAFSMLLNIEFAQLMETKCCLPRADGHSAIGVYDNVLHIYGLLRFKVFAMSDILNIFNKTGGDQSKRQVVEYDPSSDTYTDVSENYNTITDDIRHSSQGYAQSPDTPYQLYVASESTSNKPQIALFDMRSNDYTVISSIPYSGSISKGALCLVHTGTHIVVSGVNVVDSGNDYRTTVYTLRLSDSIWDNFIPDMDVFRASSCAFANNAVFTIGGFHGKYSPWPHFIVTCVSSIGKFELGSSNWLNIGELTEGSGGAGTRAVVYGDEVWVIGGWHYDESIAWPNGQSVVDTVHVINAVTNSIELMPQRLPFGFRYSSCAVAIGSIWCVGGNLPGSVYFDEIIKITIPTLSPGLNQNIMKYVTIYLYARIRKIHSISSDKITNK